MAPKFNPNAPYAPAKFDPNAQYNSADDTTTDASTPPETPPPPPSNSVGGGALRRGWETLKGTASLVNPIPQNETEKQLLEHAGPPALPLYRMGSGIVQGEKTAWDQTKQQFKDAASVAPGNPLIKGLSYVRAATTGLSMLDPFATGPVTNVNSLEDQGRTSEAVGAGLTDAAMLSPGLPKEFGGEHIRAGVSKVASLPGKAIKGIGDYRTPKSSPEIVPPVRAAAEKMATAIVPQTGQAPGLIEDTLDQRANIADYVKRTKNPMNTQAEYEQALRGAGKERYDHYQKEILNPNKNAVVDVSQGPYGGETTGKPYQGQFKPPGHATLEQINDRIGEVNRLLDPAYGKLHEAAVKAALEKPANQNLLAENRYLTDVLEKSLSERTGIPPEQIQRLRQDFGKLQSLEWTVKAARTGRMLGVGAAHEGGVGGGLGIPHASASSALVEGQKWIKGGRTAIADRAMQDAWGELNKTPSAPPRPLPKVPDGYVESRAKLAETNRAALKAEADHRALLEKQAQDAAAQRARIAADRKTSTKTAATNVNKDVAAREAVQAHESTQAAQDAAAARAAQADDLRKGVVGRQQTAAQIEATRAHELEQHAQDAASARNKTADTMRSGVVGRQEGAADTEARQAHGTEQTAQDSTSQRSLVANQARNARDEAAYAKATEKGGKPPAGLYQKYMIGPGGKRLGTLDGKNWHDVETGKPYRLPATYVPPPPGRLPTFGAKEVEPGATLPVILPPPPR